jgi:hypothetical protein
MPEHDLEISIFMKMNQCSNLLVLFMLMGSVLSVNQIKLIYQSDGLWVMSKYCIEVIAEPNPSPPRLSLATKRAQITVLSQH